MELPQCTSLTVFRHGENKDYTILLPQNMQACYKHFKTKSFSVKYQNLSSLSGQFSVYTSKVLYQDLDNSFGATLFYVIIYWFYSLLRYIQTIRISHSLIFGQYYIFL